MTSTKSAPVLHGGARRLPIRWANVAGGPPFTISRYEIAPGDVCTLHVHTGKAEYWVILAGRGTARVGDQDIVVAEGDVLATPPEVPHSLVNTGADPLVFLNLVQPVGDLPITTTEVNPAGTPP